MYTQLLCVLGHVLFDEICNLLLFLLSAVLLSNKRAFGLGLSPLYAQMGREVGFRLMVVVAVTVVGVDR